jgi:digeranylgeranylglycerophospholipid reductase
LSTIEKGYDVVVIGGGPAGLSSAKATAEAGATVVVFEEHPAIGTPVQCGELLSRSALTELGMRPSKRWLANEFRKVRLVSPGGTEAFIEMPGEVETPLFTIERKIWEKDLARLVGKAGGTIVTRAKVTDILKKDGVIQGVKVRHLKEEMTVKAKVVLACDGPGSPMGRRAGMRTPRDPSKYASIAQYQLAGIDIDPNVGECHFYPSPKDICYILPKGDGYANVGYGTLGTNSEHAITMLDGFIRHDPRLSKGSIIETNVGVEPISGVHEEISMDRLLLVGDAAGMVNPLTIAGMRFSVWAGVRAGRLAAEAIRDGDFSKERLGELRTAFLKLFGRRFRFMDALRTTVFGLEPRDLDDMFAHLGHVKIPPKMFKGKKEPVFYPLKMLVGLLIKKPRFFGKLGPIMKAWRGGE